jgi:hypothetical protein
MRSASLSIKGRSKNRTGKKLYWHHFIFMSFTVENIKRGNEMLSEIAATIRANFSEFLKWFAFFTGANLVGYGCFVG